MKHKKIRALCAVVAAALVLILAAAFSVPATRTENLQEDWTVLRNDAICGAPVAASGVEPITQEISCSYAVIVMLSRWAGSSVTEESLQAQNGGVSTSTSADFAAELNRQVPGCEFTRQSYLPDSELLVAIHNGLTTGAPVPAACAARDSSGNWTLHDSLITSMDLGNDAVVFVHPYSYTETHTIEDFPDRTSFRAFPDMPLAYQFGFAFGLFEKNTVFPAQAAAPHFSQEQKKEQNTEELLRFVSLSLRQENRTGLILTPGPIVEEMATLRR